MFFDLWVKGTLSSSSPNDLGLNTLCPCLHGELEGFAVAVAFDGEFDTAALSRGRGPGGLPEKVARAVRGNDGNLGYSDNSRAVSLRPFADAGAVGDLFKKGVTPLTGSPKGEFWVTMNSVGEELAILNPPSLDPDLKPMCTCTREVDAGNGVVRIWIAWVGHNVA
jgi:hypothetical protein